MAKHKPWMDDEDADEVEEALEQCARVRERIEDLDLDHEFLDDVYDKVGDVAETIERLQKVSDKQQTALDNWEAAVNKFRKGED
jgi:hypothetical protein